MKKRKVNVVQKNKKEKHVEEEEEVDEEEIEDNKEEEEKEEEEVEEDEEKEEKEVQKTKKNKNKRKWTISSVSHNVISTTLSIVGAYVTIYSFASEIEIAGMVDHKILQSRNPIIQFILLMSVGYMVTFRKDHSFFGTLVFFLLNSYYRIRLIKVKYVSKK